MPLKVLVVIVVELGFLVIVLSDKFVNQQLISHKYFYNYIYINGEKVFQAIIAIMGRWGRKGVGINLITRRDAPLMKQIEQHYSCQIDELPANFNNLMK